MPANDVIYLSLFLQEKFNLTDEEVAKNTKKTENKVVATS